MERIPQSILLNPSTQPKSDIYVGCLGLSSVQFNVGNNSLSMSSIMQKGPHDSLIFFTNNTTVSNLFFNDLKERNSFFFDLQYEIISFGFRVKSWYFNAGASLKGDITASYSKDFAKLLVNGYRFGDEFDLKNNGLNSQFYGEIAFGASKIIDNDWTVGAKVKLLNGFYDISTISNSFSFKSQDVSSINQLIIDADIQLNTSLPMMENVQDTGSFTFDRVFTLKDKPFSSIKLFDNLGFAADFGATYNGLNKISLSASILDLGYIKWSQNAKSYNMNIDQFVYAGLDLNMDSMLSNPDKIVDSIIDAFKLNTTGGAYTTMLPTKLYIAGEYFPVPYFSVGALSLTQYFRKSFYQQVMISANIRPMQMLMFSASYSFFDNGFSNFGLGMSLRLGSTQFYFISDNIPFRYSSGLALPYKAKYFSFRYGLNFVFGCSDKQKEKDKALNYE